MEGGKKLLSKEKATIELDTRSEDRKEDHRETTNTELRGLVSEDQERAALSPEIPAERHNERGHVEEQRSTNYRW